MNLTLAIHHRIPISVETISAVGYCSILHRSQRIKAERNTAPFIVIGVEDEKNVVVFM